MKKFTIVFLGLALIILGSCAETTYKPDHGFLNSAQAGAFEYPIMVNGTLCRDMDSQVGFCAKRIADNTQLQIKVSAQQYAYRFHVVCSQELGVDYSEEVVKDREALISIGPNSFDDLQSFTCIVEIFPKDRPEEVSAKARVSVVLYDHNYVGRERITMTERGEKSYLYLGDHAKYAKVCIGAECRRYKERTILEVPRGPTIFAYSESERMRFNYFSNR